MNILLTSYHLGTTVSFETYDGKLHKNLKFVAILDGTTVQKLGFDAHANHRQILGFLPEGIPNDWKAYNYAKFFNVGGGEVYLGIPWVIPESIREVVNSPYLIKIWNVDSSAIESIRSMMVANGVKDFEITRL